MTDKLSPGDVVWVDLNPVVGHEQAGWRPAVVVSSRECNSSSHNVVIVVPVTARDRGLPHQVPMTGDGLGLTATSYAMTEQPHAVDRRRLGGSADRVAGRHSGPSTPTWRTSSALDLKPVAEAT